MRDPLNAPPWREGRAARVALPCLGAFAVLWPVWFLWGLRFTNHDDIAFGMVAWTPEIAWMDYAHRVAQAHRRVQAYLGMPLSLAGNWLAGFRWGDVVLAGQSGFCLGLFMWAGRGLLPARMLVLLAFGLANLFAVHFYFTAPPGYALVGLFWPMAFLACAGLLRRGLAREAWLPWGALGWWLLLVPGPEYNLFIFGAPLLLLILASNAPVRTKLRHALAFAMVGAAVVTLYVGFRLLHPDAVEGERLAVTLGGGWWSTLGVLAGKALLPSGLAMGIDLALAPVPGTPALPRLLEWQWMWGTLRGDVWNLAALAASVACFAVLLGGARARPPERWIVLAAALGFLVMPAAMVSVSGTYQRIVAAGYVQGHLASAYVQAGAIVLVLAAVGGRGWGWPARVAMASPLGALAVVTLGYNLAMRDAMSANQQKWQAFAVLAEAGARGPVHAPSFWWQNAVAAPAVPFHPASGPYWDDYARYVLGAPLRLRGAGEAAQPGDAEAGYMVSADGDPVAWLRQDGALTLLAHRPARVRLAGPDGVRAVSRDAWRCEALCRLAVDGIDPTVPGWLLPDVRGASQLPARLVVKRRGAFGAR